MFSSVAALDSLAKALKLFSKIQSAKPTSSQSPMKPKEPWIKQICKDPKRWPLPVLAFISPTGCRKASYEKANQRACRAAYHYHIPLTLPSQQYAVTVDLPVVSLAALDVRYHCDPAPVVVVRHVLRV